MTGALLETKFHLPQIRRGVARPRLSKRLDRAWESALTVVSAPAGFGKTTLLTQWLATQLPERRPTAWLSLDRSDNDPRTFWTYLVSALRIVAGTVGAEALALLQSPRPPMEAVLSSLINDLNGQAGDVLLVVDDYHLIDSREVQEDMAFLLDHCPAQVHLVIVGRADPPLPLARMRTRGELVEIRAADLRFTAGEAAAYLDDVMGLDLTAQDIATLDSRTEGWIAALQLAALSLQGRDDVAAFIAGFAGDDRYIVDYLVEEVLDRQPADVRRFLLQTSILGRLTGPLCEVVTGQPDAKAMLAMLERGNLFLLPLDDRRSWYRYHQLFADVLHAHLLDERPGDVLGLHRRASAWYEGQGDVSQAIDHAMAAPDFERAAELLERAIPDLSRRRQEGAVRTWLELIPDDVVRVRPVLIVGFAGSLLSGGQFEGVESLLRDAERWLDQPRSSGADAAMASPEMVVADHEQLRHLPALIELYRAALQLALGHPEATVQHARRAIDLSAEGHIGRASAAGLLGLAAWTGGDLETAHSAYTACSAGLLRAGYVADTLGCAVALADIRQAQGRLGAALRTLESALQRAGEQDGTALRGTADMHVGISSVLRERGDLSGARQQLLRSDKCGEHNGLPQNRYRRRVAMARILTAEGDLDGAVALLDEAERLYVGDFFPAVRPVPALRARVWILQGKWRDAAGWAQEQNLAAGDDLSYLREFEHITLARMLLAQSPAGRPDDELTDLLERLRIAAEQGKRAGSVLELLMLQALSHQGRGDTPAALASLQGALDLAEPEGYLDLFVAEGPPMAALLRAVEHRAKNRKQVGALLAALDAAVVTTSPGPIDRHDPVHRLSRRELDVLALLGTDLAGPDIARRLFVSLNTVRTHTKNVYEKLGVNSRRAAVRRGIELELIPPVDR